MTFRFRRRNVRPAVAIITVARHRRAHLARQRAWLRRNAPEAEHVIVDLGGEPLTPGPERIVEMTVTDGEPLPLAGARNAGARAAHADLLVFLDVDCLPAPALVPSYADRVARHGGVWSGPVGYLPPSDEIADWSVEHLMEIARFHDGRPQPGRAPERAADPDLFWSLSFAVSRRDWERIGGFDEAFVGYGAEDTDFGHTARARDVQLWYDGHALAFHQHHPVSSPPVEHLDDIVVNATIFHAKWGRWPMRGWLEAFRDEGLIDWEPWTDAIFERVSNRTESLRRPPTATRVPRGDRLTGR